VGDLTAAEARVLDNIDETWLVDRLREFVAIPSVGGSDAESEAQHVVAGWLDGMGADVDAWPIDLLAAAAADDAPGQEVSRQEAWGVVGTVAGRDGGEPALVLSGHTDVVPAPPRGPRPATPPCGPPTRSPLGSPAACCTAAGPAT
jgi:acetylornithine deacetylase